MHVHLTFRGSSYRADLSAAIDLSRPVKPGGGVSAFGLGHPRAVPVEVGGGRRLDTREGGGVNCHDITWNAHGHGTHTESLAHITDDGLDVDEVAPRCWLLAQVVRVQPVAMADSGETYAAVNGPNDRLVTAAVLQDAVMQDAVAHAGDRVSEGDEPLATLIVCTEPYDREDETDYTGRNPPYFSAEAMAFIAALPIDHLVVDLPSIDRENDGGTTPNHRRFWGLPPASRRASDARFPRRTVTELARVPGDVASGLYLLSLQVAPLKSDAAPSRPMLVPLGPASSSVSAARAVAVDGEDSGNSSTM